MRIIIQIILSLLSIVAVLTGIFGLAVGLIPFAIFMPEQGAEMVKFQLTGVGIAVASLVALALISGLSEFINPRSK